MKEKAILLLSAGLDSTFNLYRSVRELDVVCALTFDYGQRAAQREIEKAVILSRRFQIRHEVISIPFLRQLGGSSLTDATQELPTRDQVQINDLTQSTKTAASVWVPNRNGLFLNIAGCFADRLEAQWIIPGFNKEEASTFPDNSEDFMKALDHSFSFSTRVQARVKCYSSALTKNEIVREGLKLNMNFSEIWPCYTAGAGPANKWCGVCESCKRSHRALESNGVSSKELFV